MFLIKKYRDLFILKRLKILYVMNVRILEVKVKYLKNKGKMGICKKLTEHNFEKVNKVLIFKIYKEVGRRIEI